MMTEMKDHDPEQGEWMDLDAFKKAARATEYGQVLTDDELEELFNLDDENPNVVKGYN